MERRFGWSVPPWLAAPPFYAPMPIPSVQARSGGSGRRILLCARPSPSIVALPVRGPRLGGGSVLLTDRQVLSLVRSHGSGPLIADAARLYIEPNDKVVDVTWGRGSFWTHFRPKHLIGHDLHTHDGVDFRRLPEADASVDVVMFDPPYCPGFNNRKKRLPSTFDSGDFNNRFGLDRGPEKSADIRLLIEQGMAEAVRVLKPGGRLMVKCMDYISRQGKFQAGRHHVVETALRLGLEQLDEFVHDKGQPGARPKYQPNGQPARQLHARRSHSFLCVFRKPSTRRTPRSTK